MLQFSYMMLKIYGKVKGLIFVRFSSWYVTADNNVELQGNFTVEEQRAREKFEVQAKEKMESIKLVLEPPNIVICVISSIVS